MKMVFLDDVVRKRRQEEQERLNRETLEEIEQKLKDTKKKKRRLKLKRGFVRMLGVTYVALGVSIPCGIIGAVLKQFNHSPFEYDIVKDALYTKTEYSSNKGTTVSKQYTPFGEGTSSLNFYSGWTQNEDGQYVSTVKSFDVKDKTFEELSKEYDLAEVTAEDITEPVIFEKEITKKEITEEDKDGKPYLELLVYGKDEENGRVRTQTENDQNDDVGTWVAVSFIPAFGAALLTIGDIAEGVTIIGEKLDTYPYSYSINNYGKDIKVLKKRIKEKKNNNR